MPEKEICEREKKLSACEYQEVLKFGVVILGRNTLGF